jgi:hypothetical protein
LVQEIGSAQADVAELEWAYGVAAVDNPEAHRPTMRGFKIAHGQLGKQLRAARERLSELLSHRRGIPPRVQVGDLSDGTVVKLAAERKHLTNLIKMVAYQTESDLLALLRPHYASSDDEGLTLLHELFHAAADIDVTETELRVAISPLNAPHRTLARRHYAKFSPRRPPSSQEPVSRCASPSIRGRSSGRLSLGHSPGPLP